MNFQNLSVDLFEREKLVAVVLGDSQYFHGFLPPKDPSCLKNEEKSLTVFGRRIGKITVLTYGQCYSIRKVDSPLKRALPEASLLQARRPLQPPVDFLSHLQSGWEVGGGRGRGTEDTKRLRRSPSRDLSKFLEPATGRAWTARRSKQSKEISPENSLGRLMLKLKRQYFGHLMR